MRKIAQIFLCFSESPNFKPRPFSLPTIILSYNSLLESQWNGNFDLLKISQAITKLICTDLRYEIPKFLLQLLSSRLSHKRIIVCKLEVLTFVLFSKPNIVYYCFTTYFTFFTINHQF